jgi:hypothetical protein
MKYTSIKIPEQELAYRITTTNNGEEITFNVVCANDESEIEGLIEFHFDTINNPKAVVPQEPAALTKEQLLAQLQALQAQIESLA